jgi:Domain of unknown function (DUF4194)
MSELAEFHERGIAAIKLLQGVVYSDDEDAWSILLNNESDLAEYFNEIGLALVIDRGEGIAYLKQYEDDERSEGYERLPRLFRKTPLGYEATLLCVLLRDEYRRFEEEDLDNERCVVEMDGLFEMWKSFFPADSDEVTLRKRLTTSLILETAGPTNPRPNPHNHRRSIHAAVVELLTTLPGCRAGQCTRFTQLHFDWCDGS